VQSIISHNRSDPFAARFFASLVKSGLMTFKPCPDDELTAAPPSVQERTDLVAAGGGFASPAAAAIFFSSHSVESPLLTLLPSVLAFFDFLPEGGDRFGLFCVEIALSTRSNSSSNACTDPHTAHDTLGHHGQRK
jgi:hypothetical protein